MDRKDLKIEALLQRVSRLTTEYENQVADLRVDLTEHAYENQELRSRVETLEQEVAKYEEPADTQEDPAPADHED